MAEFDIGFLGGGQLARMSIQAAQRMGLRCLSLDPGDDTPASQITPAIQGRLDDPERIAEILRRSDRVTLENEFIPVDAIRQAVDLARFNEESLIPGIDALATIQDKLHQRLAYEANGVPSPKAVAIHGDGAEAIREIGFPMVLKARFGGYDGKGTRYARTREEFESHRALWAQGGWLAESFVPFKRELAVMVYVPAAERGAQASRLHSRAGVSPATDGPSAAGSASTADILRLAQDDKSRAGCFPTMETIQTNHVCDLVFPSGADASKVALAAVRAIGGVGLYGVELFEEEGGRMSVNEMAPRPHNTGHYTLDWGGVSQFEQHVRLVIGLPPVVPQGQDACMANLLGQEGAGDFRCGLRAALAAEPEAHVHWYGKAESRPGRKMGHINTVGSNAVERAKRARAAFYEGWVKG